MKPAVKHTAWLLGWLLAWAIILHAFWILLGHRYSPENYQSRPVLPDTLEFAWIGLGIVTALIIVLRTWRDAELVGRLLRASWFVVAVCGLEIGLSLLGRTAQTSDVILFAFACGWAVRGGMQRDSAVPANGIRLWQALVWGGTLVLGGYFIWQQIRYLNNLALGYNDCGEAARIMFNTLHNPRELFLRINPDKPLFLDHFQPGVLPFVPLWLLWPRLELTIVLQVMATVGCVVLVYALGKQILRDELGALLLALAWLVYPSISQMIYNASYGFYWGRLCLPLYFAALWLWLRGHNKWALGAVIWAVLIKEEAAILLGMFGLHLALFKGRRRLGLMVAAGGFAYFLVMTMFVIPAFRGGNYAMLGYFSELGESHGEILFSPVTKPLEFWGKLFEGANFYFAGCLFVPLLFLPLRKPSLLFVGSVVFLFLCLWNNPNVKSICFWYQTSLLPVLFWALAEALRAQPVERQRAALVGVTVSGVVLSLFLGNAFWSKDNLGITLHPGRLAVVKRMAQRIDARGALVATQRVGAQFIGQKYLYLASNLPATTDYVLLDLRDNWRPRPDIEWLRDLRRFQQEVEESGLPLLAAEDGLLLYGRGQSALDAQSVVEQDTLPAKVIHDSIPLGDRVNVVGYQIELIQREGHNASPAVRVRIFSSTGGPVAENLAARCTFKIGAGPVAEQYASEFQPLGQGIWPTTRWRPGKLYADEFIIDLPYAPAGQACSISFSTEKLGEK